MICSLLVEVIQVDLAGQGPELLKAHGQIVGHLPSGATLVPRYTPRVIPCCPLQLLGYEIVVLIMDLGLD